MLPNNLIPGNGMNKLDILIGLLLGLIGTFIGCFLFITLITNYDFVTGIQAIKHQGSLGKLVTIGTTIDLLFFFILLKLKKEIIARGIIVSVILLAVLTLIL